MFFFFFFFFFFFKIILTVLIIIFIKKTYVFNILLKKKSTSHMLRDTRQFYKSDSRKIMSKVRGDNSCLRVGLRLYRSMDIRLYMSTLINTFS